MILPLTLLAITLAAPPTAEPPAFELIVVGEGDGVYARFGHAAFRAVDPKAKLDHVFNFGVTNFKRPNYIRDFLTGQVRFWGNVKPWGRTLERHRRRDRTVWRYPMHLTREERAALHARLRRDVQPEHREYVYDTFRENCATRLRDYLDDVTDGLVHRSLEGAPLGGSYRDDVRRAFAKMPPLLLLTEIIPGVPLDAPRTVWEHMYHPVKLGAALAQVKRADGRPLLGTPIVEYQRAGAPPLSGWPHRGQLFLVLWAAGVFVIARQLRHVGRRARALLAGGWAVFSGLLGVVLEVVAFGTVWPDMQQNTLVAGFVSLDLLLLAPAARMMLGRLEFAGPWVRRYLDVRLWLLVALIGLGLVYPQTFGGPLPPRLLALAGVFLLRAGFLHVQPARR
jgi:hypothetical protein